MRVCHRLRVSQSTKSTKLDMLWYTILWTDTKNSLFNLTIIHTIIPSNSSDAEHTSILHVSQPNTMAQRIRHLKFSKILGCATSKSGRTTLLEPRVYACSPLLLCYYLFSGNYRAKWSGEQSLAPFHRASISESQTSTLVTTLHKV